jgi:nucleoside-diphosphate-sugar epimerase
MAKVIIGCGYLGRRVAALWRPRTAVHATARSPARADELRALGIAPWPVPCDVLDPASVRACIPTIPPASTVLYAVGHDPASGASRRDVAVEGLRNVLAALTPPRRFLYVSSTSVYGQAGGEEVDESAPTEPAEESGRVTLEAERVLHECLPDGVVLRLAGIYGPGRLLRGQAVRAGEPIVGDPDRWLNLSHVEDAAAAVLAADERGRPGAVYNVSDGRPVRRRDFYRLLARLLGGPEPRFVPPPPGAPLPAHERANRRILNRRLREELGVALRYPTYEEGLPASVTAGPG